MARLYGEETKENIKYKEDKVVRPTMPRAGKNPISISNMLKGDSTTSNVSKSGAQGSELSGISSSVGIANQFKPTEIFSEKHKAAVEYQDRIDKMNIPRNIQEERERVAKLSFIKCM